MTEYKFTEIKTNRFEEREISVDEMLDLFKDHPEYNCPRDVALRELANTLLEHPCVYARFNFIVGKTHLRATVKASDIIQAAALLDKDSPDN